MNFYFYRYAYYKINYPYQLNIDANVIFFITFIIIAQYIMLNLFILILMQNFEQFYINADNPLSNF